MLKFIKEMSNESPFILVVILVVISKMISTVADMIVNIFRICIGG